MGEIIFKNENIPAYDTGKSLSQNAKEAVKYSAAANTIKDSFFIESVESEIKGSILESTKADRKIDRIEKSAEVLDKENLKNENYFKKHKPVLIFGGIDGACDLSVMKIMFFIMVIPYFVTALIIKAPLRILSEIFDEFNKMLIAIASFSKPAKMFCLIIIWSAIALTVIFLLIKGAEIIFDIDILGNTYGSL